MTQCSRIAKTVLFCAIAALTMASLHPAVAASGHGLDQDADAALKSLYDKTPAAKTVGNKAKAILVFPNIVKAGFIVGAQGGEGVMFKNGKPTGYYNSVALSAGLQVGMQGFGYALFFMTDSAVNYLAKSRGWEIGMGPSIVVVDAGAAKDLLSTTTSKSDIYGFIFDQKGLMAGITLQGSKITKIDR